ncbi:MAG: hypothetical protein JWN14_311 [Chthonomonadales bacterium]|nr:hypothetical protein [Chthonomonadales bacterium]
MRLRKIGLIAASLITTLAVTTIGRTDEVSDARKAVQAAYDREAVAASKLDVEGMFASHSPGFVAIDSVEGHERKETLKFIKEKDSVFLQNFKSIRRKDTIRKFRLKGNVAIVDCAVHEITVMINPDTNKPWPPESSDDINRDTWVKGKSGWLMTTSKALSSEHPSKSTRTSKSKA